MTLRLLISFFFLILTVFGEANEKKIVYDLRDDPIDVVIVTHPKDTATLDECIKGIKENCKNIRRIIVVSSKKLSKKAEWFDEGLFPFTKEEIAMAVVKDNKKMRESFFRRQHRSPGWYYQQCLKLYASFVIPKISSNVLILDSDTIFLNPVELLNESFGGLFCFNNKKEARPSYFIHAKRLVPGYKRVHSNIYSVCHHMLFQKAILKDLFLSVETYHEMPFWKAFCNCVDLKANKGASEFEIYFNFAITHTSQVEMRELKWTNCGDLSQKESLKENGYHFVSFHTYLRRKNTNTMLKGGTH